MAIIGALDKTKHLSEFNDPLPNNAGGYTPPATRKAAARANLGITANITNLNQNAGATGAAVTTTADGLTTGLIAAGVTAVIITSGAATNAATLPGIAANGLPIGYTIRLRVGANGLELLTPASSNETINGVDSDGTNQLDVAANSMLTAVVESATGWMVGQASAVAPDND